MYRHIVIEQNNSFVRQNACASSPLLWKIVVGPRCIRYPRERFGCSNKEEIVNCFIEKTFSLAILLVLCLFVACGGGGSDSDGSSINQSSPELATPRISTLCGVSEQEKIVAQPTAELEEVSAQILSSDAAIITRRNGELAGQQQLIKFHAITSDGVETLRVLNGMDVLQRELAAGAYFLSSGADCEVTLEGGGAGVLGQLYSFDGESMSERMLMEAAAAPMPADSCDGNLLAQCYDTIGVTPRQPTDIELDVQDVSIASRCGAVREGSLENPVTSAELVRVEPLSTDLVVVTRLLGVEAGNTQLVKLHGLTSSGVSPQREELGKNFIINNSVGGAYLSTASQECAVEVSGGGMGVVGQFYSQEGVSINEALLANGYALAAEDFCQGELLSECYAEIEAEAPPEPIPEPPAPENPGSDDDEGGGNYVEGIIRDFLWKPVSESNGNLVVLVNPTNVRVEVSGARSETLRNQGPSNGRGTTARASAPGCAYGSNVVVRFFDSSGQAIPIISGGTTITIPNGCSRVEFRR